MKEISTVIQSVDTHLLSNENLQHVFVTIDTQKSVMIASFKVNVQRKDLAPEVKVLHFLLDPHPRKTDSGYSVHPSSGEVSVGMISFDIE